jgi:DNA-binding transcriptional LysR family regulator
LTDRPPVIRLGYHGSLLLPTRIAATAGLPEWTELRRYDLIDPFRALRAGELDVMIVTFAVNEPGLRYSAVLGTEDRAALVGAGHPLARRDAVSIEELADFDTFGRPGAFPAAVWDEVVPPVTPAGRPMRRVHDMASTAAMMKLVADGRAVHISLRSLADVAPLTVRVVPIHDLPAAPVALAWCRDLEHIRAFVGGAEAALATDAPAQAAPTGGVQQAPARRAAAMAAHAVR